MTAADTDLDALFKRLHLANARRVWRDLVQRAERETWAYADFLTLLVSEEIAHRQQTRLGRLTRRAQFPFLKTIDDFNFTYQSSLRLHMLGSALSVDFVTEGRSLILAGKPGRGKTHLAIAIAYRAIQNGFDAFFTTAAALIDDLSAAFRAGELAQALPTYTHPAVLIVDEVGYLTYGTDAANMLFHVVNERHRRHRPMIFTTNKSLKAWGRVLHDDDLAQAIIDRVLERGRLLRLDGPSVRTLHVNLDDAMKEESDQQANLVRISGKSRSEFPEPTVPTDPTACGGIDANYDASTGIVNSNTTLYIPDWYDEYPGRAQGVAAHELGHVFGLENSACAPQHSVMWTPAAQSIENCRASPSGAANLPTPSDGMAAARTVYGTASRAVCPVQ